MLAELVNVLYSVIDRMYIGHIPNVGAQCLTGIGLTIPLVSMISAFSNLCATGGASLASIERGKGDNEKAAHIQNTSFTMLLVFGVVITAVLMLCSEPILLLIGADADTLPFAMDYFSVYRLGTVFSLISIGMNPFINALGFSGVGMVTVMAGALLNLALDPLLIFTFGLGVRGAAIATVIAQTFSALWVTRFLFGKKTPLRISRLELSAEYIGRIMRLGVTGFTFKMTNSAVQAVFNSTLGLFGGVQSVFYIGAMSIINSLREVINQPIFALAHGAQPVQSFNYGAKLYRRVLDSIKFETASIVVYNFGAFLVIQLFAEKLASIFTVDPVLIRHAAHCMRLYFATFFFMGLQQAAQNTFVALNYPKYALFFSLFRKAFLVIPLTLLLPRIGFGADGVFYAEATSEVIGSVTTYTTFILVIIRKLRRAEKEEMTV